MARDSSCRYRACVLRRVAAFGESCAAYHLRGASPRGTAEARSDAAHLHEDVDRIERSAGTHPHAQAPGESLQQEGGGIGAALRTSNTSESQTSNSPRRVRHVGLWALGAVEFDVCDSDVLDS